MVKLWDMHKHCRNSLEDNQPFKDTYNAEECVAYSALIMAQFNDQIPN